MGSLLDHLGDMLGSSRGQFLSNLEAVSFASWGHLGVILGSFWGQLLGHLGLISGHFGFIRESFQHDLWIMPDSLGGHLYII